MSKRSYSIGLDYGTNSVRGVIVDVNDGNEITASIYKYKRGESGIILDKSNVHVARQSPEDYVDGFEYVIAHCLQVAKQSENITPDQTIGIGKAFPLPCCRSLRIILMPRRGCGRIIHLQKKRRPLRNWHRISVLNICQNVAAFIHRSGFFPKYGTA